MPLLLYFIEKVNHLKLNHARWRKGLRKTHLKVIRKGPRKTAAQDFHARLPRKTVEEATLDRHGSGQPVRGLSLTRSLLAFVCPLLERFVTWCLLQFPRHGTVCSHGCRPSWTVSFPELMRRVRPPLSSPGHAPWASLAAFPLRMALRQACWRASAYGTFGRVGG